MKRRYALRMEQPISGSARRRYTVAEYIASEAVATERHEYCDGQILDMAGATSNHVRIVRNLTRRLDEGLETTDCEVFPLDQRVRADRARYCYPDLTVACHPLTYDPIGESPEAILTNARVLIEVLSPSTESSDRGEKFTRYRNLATLEEYLLVAQDRPRVEPFYRKADGEWTIGKVIDGLDAVVPIRCLGIELLMKHIYARVAFPPEVAEPDVL